MVIDQKTIDTCRERARTLRHHPSYKELPWPRFPKVILWMSKIGHVYCSILLGDGLCEEFEVHEAK